MFLNKMRGMSVSFAATRTRSVRLAAPLVRRAFGDTKNSFGEQVFEVEDEIELREKLYGNDLEGTTVLDCYADWCGPCKTLTPLLEREVAKHPQNKLRLAKLNVDVHERMPASLKVTAIPAVFAFYKGNMIASFIGVPSEENLETWIKNVADPDEILADEASVPDGKQ